MKDATLDRADQIVEQAGWTGLLVARLLPLVAFTAINWGAGLTSVSRWRFLWTTAVGIIPGAIVFTASGSGVAALLKQGAGSAAWLAAVTLIGFLVFVLVRGHRPAESTD